MSTVAYMSMAGSTGKTVTAIATACKLAADGLEVDVVDIDLQANPTSWLGYDGYDGPTVADVLKGRASLKEVRLPARYYLGRDAEDEDVYKYLDRVRIIPASRESLSPLSVEMVTNPDLLTSLSDAMTAEAHSDPDEVADVRLLDCGGVDSPFNTLAMLTTAAEAEFPGGGSGLSGVITCSAPGRKEMEGLDPLITTLKRASKLYRRQFDLLSVVPTIVPIATGAPTSGEKALREYHFRPATGFHELLEVIEDEYADAAICGVTPPVRETRHVKRAFNEAIPLHVYRPTRDVAGDYDRVVEHQKSRGLWPTTSRRAV
ncbi:ParA family protein [Nocardia neocaledoniensis]|uniref:ParA family protein n=1 Tax=Nocardia neocaledoniensis TaxID=236511 RepID=UPI002457CC08|nr:ParA family protein [Nocardia neocaledoniensis]